MDILIEINNSINNINNKLKLLEKKEKIVNKKVLEFNTYLEIKERYVKRHTNSYSELVVLSDTMELISVLTNKLDEIKKEEIRLTKEVKKLELKTLKYKLKHPCLIIKNKIKKYK